MMEGIDIPGETIAYARDLYQPEDALLTELREALVPAGLPQIEVGPEEGRLLQMLVAAAGGQRVLEIGTLGGYSGIWLARGLAPGGKLVTLELEQKHADFARGYFERAGLADRVEIRVGRATETLPTLTDGEPFDLVFIDANKDDYDSYLDWAVRLVRRGGWITAHNTLGWGNIHDPANQDASTVAIRRFNQAVADHPKLLATIVPVQDGLTIALKIAD